MRSPEQIRSELPDTLAQLGRLRPEWRLGQTVGNLATTAGRLDQGAVRDLEDEEALAAARTLIEQYADLAPVVAEPGAVADRGGATPQSLAASLPARSVS